MTDLQPSKFWYSRSILSDDVTCSCEPIKSIRDIGTILSPVWTMEVGYAAGRRWSLNDVEDYLRNPKPFK